MNYKELKQKQKKEIDLFFENYGFFAFSKMQFADGMQSLQLDAAQDLYKICRVMSGGYLLKDQAQKFANLLDSHKREASTAIAADLSGMGYIKSMFFYELSNHEYCYTHELGNTLAALDLTLAEIEKNPALKTGLKLALAEYNEVSADY
jgi:hypothetical protein